MPRAGGPSAGRGPQAGQYQSPQQQVSPQRTGSFEAQPGGYESQSGGYDSPRTGSTPVAGPGPRQDVRPDRTGSPGRERRPEVETATQQHDRPFEEAAFEDDGRGDWGGGGESLSGQLGYKPRERRRSDFQKVRSRARKSSPWPKVVAAIVALGLVGGGVWWFVNRDSGEEAGGGEDTGLTYSGSEEPCSLVDSGPLEPYAAGTEPTAAAEGEQKSRGWVQSCTLTYGEVGQAAALLEVEGTVFDSEAKASVNYELGTGEIGEMTELWTPVDPAPSIGDQAVAVARVVTDGTSNYQLYLQDDNVYLVVRLSVGKDAGLDQQGLTDLSVALADAYLANWRDAS